MSLTKDEKSKDVHYRLISVEKSAPPAAQEGRNWYRYVIERGNSTIDGHRRGTLQQVTHYAKSFAEDLNARVNGRGTSTWAPRGRK